MRILAIDTSTWVCAAAVLQDGAVHAERSEHSKSHATTLPALVDAVLADGGGRLTAGDVVAASIGPGSFTGLRIGLGLVKGMAFAGGLGIIGVPTLDAWAVAAPAWEGRLCAVLDARKQEVYAALYERSGTGIVRLGEAFALGARALGEQIAGPCTFVGDAVDVYRDVLTEVLGERAAFLAPSEHASRAVAVARLAAGRLRDDPAGDPIDEIAPVYVRPPEAELKQSAMAPSKGAAAPTFVDKVPLLY